ncbi:MAG TPA: peptidylprolyl isomerase [Kofleriaceae bacterium]
MRVAILLVCLAVGATHAGKRVVERVVAVVDGNIILASELEQQLAPLRAQAEQLSDPKERERRIAKLHNQVLDEMINEELIVQTAEAAKITVEADEVRAAIDDIKQQNNLDDAAFAEALASQGMTIESYKKVIGRTLLRHRAVNQLVAPKVSITDEDTRARYDQMQRRSESVSAVAVGHILFALPEHPTEQQLAEAKAKAARALERAKAGESFATLAAELSDDAGTKATGGGLGWFERGTASPEWEAVVFAMEKGDVRGPVKSAQGIHVLLAMDVKRAQSKPYAEMKDGIALELKRRAIEKATQTWLEDLRKKAHIEVKP